MTAFIKREYDYALRICAYLAGRRDSPVVPISHLSKMLYITRPFTTKIVYQLKNKHILGTVQGKEGGVYLIRPAEEITIFEVLDAMGFNSRLNECLDEDYDCPVENRCRLHLFFEELEKQMMDRLKSKTLSNVALLINN